MQKLELSRTDNDSVTNLLQENLKASVTQQLRILLAGGSAASRLSLQARLSGRGYQVISTADRADLESALSLGGIHICLLDWDMPAMIGIELCESIRSADLKSRPYVLLLTSRKEPKHIVLGYEAGADDYLIKPFSCDELLAKISAFAIRIAELEGLESEFARMDPIDAYRLSLRDFGFRNLNTH